MRAVTGWPRSTAAVMAALRASRDYYVSQGLSTMPLDGWHAAAVPGAPHAYATLNREFGTLPLADLLAPALAYAERGIAVSEDMSRSIAGAAGKLGRFADSAALYFPGGVAPRPGDRWVLPDLARTIRAYATGGPEAFYRGEVAAEIVRASTAGGGLFGPRRVRRAGHRRLRAAAHPLPRRGRV